MPEVIKAPVMFPSAKDAIAVLGVFDAFAEKAGVFYQYEVNTVFNVEREVIGYRIHVKDTGGFFIGYLC